MKLPLSLALTVLATTAINGCASDLVLEKPSVVVLYTPDADISRVDQNEPGFPDFLDDFQTYQASVASALEGNPQIRYIATTARLVRFKGTSRTVSRQALGGYGFVVFVPGETPVVFQGVATDHDVLCELRRQMPGAITVKGCGA
jgi:hypothetical protein